MRSYGLTIAALALTVTAVNIAHADASAYAEANVYTTWYNAGPDLAVSVSSSDGGEIYDYWGPNFGVYTNTPNLWYTTNSDYAAIRETSYGASATGYLADTGTLFFVYDNGPDPESITFYSTGYVSGDTAISNATDIAGFDSLAGLAVEQGQTTSWVDYTVLDEWDSGYVDSSYSVTDTILVQPGQETFFEAVTDVDTVTYSTDTRATPGPMAAGPFLAGLVGLVRRRRGR